MHARIPWQRLVQLRNFYTHAYERLTPEEIWGTAKRLVPRIGKFVASIVVSEDEGL